MWTFCNSYYKALHCIFYFCRFSDSGVLSSCSFRWSLGGWLAFMPFTQPGNWRLHHLVEYRKYFQINRLFSTILKMKEIFDVAHLHPVCALIFIRYLIKGSERFWFCNSKFNIFYSFKMIACSAKLWILSFQITIGVSVQFFVFW
jgi:hypothetical protein